MNMQPPERRSLWALTIGSGAGRLLSDDIGRVALDDVRGGCSVDGPLESLRGRSVLIATDAQRPAVLAAIALDGVARRILLCPADIDPAHLPAILAEGQVDTIVTDGTGPATGLDLDLPITLCRDTVAAASAPVDRSTETEWVLFTSGTTGRPKLVAHSLLSLTGPLDDGLAVASGAVWSTFYDVRRYGGLQILLRALLGGGSMVLSSAKEPVGAFLVRAGQSGVTHISGTPSHWRRALMSPSAGSMAPAYVRLSGEVADQAILDQLSHTYRGSSVAHAFASTEAGVGFDVRDGLAGFPTAYIGAPGAKAELRVQDGTLRIRSARTASGYLHAAGQSLGDADGFVDTGDMVEQHGDRFYFIGRREGVINVGGQKVHPEEVEAVLNQHPDISMSRAWARNSPITGAVVAAEIVIKPSADFAATQAAALELCRTALPAYKVPVTIRHVTSLPIAPSGKLVRTRA
jgi:acyl-CoA synthetase (AMP-forming)/AMP-acid ligase II